MTDVERVARALCVADGYDPDSNWRPFGSTEKAKPTKGWEGYVEPACVAIKAMQEPVA